MGAPDDQRVGTVDAGSPSLKRVAIVGATGYTGQELQRLLTAHPGFGSPLRWTARTPAPDAPDRPSLGAPEPFDPERLAELDGLFLCTPHGVSAPLVQAAIAAGCPVVDLSADFRLRDPDVYADAYGAPHPAPALLHEAVYGLTEHERTRVASARVVANPGCYPTSVLLPLLPLLSARLIDLSETLVCDCKSGVSGAGNNPGAGNLFGAVHDNFRAYGVGRHRHTPEIQQEAGITNLLFVPHLLPVFRGILSTIYLRPARGLRARDLRAQLQDRYAGEPFVRILDEGQPMLSDVQTTNRCHVALEDQGGHVVVTSVLDNLVKGAAGQALQNMNLLLGFPEHTGLA